MAGSRAFGVSLWHRVSAQTYFYLFGKCILAICDLFLKWKMFFLKKKIKKEADTGYIWSLQDINENRFEKNAILINT